MKTEANFLTEADLRANLHRRLERLGIIEQGDDAAVWDIDRLREIKLNDLGQGNFNRRQIFAALHGEKIVAKSDWERAEDKRKPKPRHLLYLPASIDPDPVN